MNSIRSEEFGNFSDSDEDREPFKCEVCAFQVKNAKGLKIHKKKNTSFVTSLVIIATKRSCKKIEFEKQVDARNIIEQVGKEESSENYLSQPFCVEKCFGIFKTGRFEVRWPSQSLPSQ